MRQSLTNRLFIGGQRVNRKRGGKKTIREVLSSGPPEPATGYWIKSYEQLSGSSTLEIKGKLFISNYCSYSPHQSQVTPYTYQRCTHGLPMGECQAGSWGIDSVRESLGQGARDTVQPWGQVLSTGSESKSGQNCVWQPWLELEVNPRGREVSTASTRFNKQLFRRAAVSQGAQDSQDHFMRDGEDSTIL